MYCDALPHLLSRTHAQASLTIRVLSSRSKVINVELSDEVLRALRYPRSLPATSLAVCLFQRLDGCDVLLYAM